MTTKKLEHMGIKAQLLGQIDVATERGVKHEFMSMGACAMKISHSSSNL